MPKLSDRTTMDKLPKVDLVADGTSFEQAIGELAKDIPRTPMEDSKDVMRASLRQDDLDRINSATNLINTWNYAVQVQGNRAKWTPSDYEAFAIALVAIDSVGKSVADVGEQLDPYRSFNPANQS